MNPNDIAPEAQGDVIDLKSLLQETTQEDIIPVNLVDEEPPANEEEPKNEEPAPPTTEEKVVPISNYKAFVLKKIEAGEWFDVEGIADVDVDEEVFNEIVEAQIAKHKETATENTVKTDTLSPMMLKALEIDKNGGSVSQVFETYKNIYENPENPIAGLNLENPEHQENLLRYYHKNRGLGDFEVNAIIEGHKKGLTLNAAADKAKQDIDTLFNNYLEQQTVQVEAAKKEKQEALKTYRSNISEEIKKYDLNDNYKKTIVDKISKPDEKGNYAVDAMFDEWRRNPEKAVKIAMFMNNEEEYVKTRASKVINSEKEKIFTTIKLTNKGKGTGTVDYNSSKTEREDVLSLADL